ncbi:MAG: hypothetical protein FJ221_08015 [Lentisphaerae bacterium]|nr:hypothetical protein [Lentisphaerota bacterium]
MQAHWKLGMAPVLLAGCVAAAAEGPGGAVAATNPVTYEAFGAVGDGVADDLAAICAAHAHANRHGLPVRSNPKATYQLGRTARTAVIATDTDWSTSRFLIDDSQGVENHRKSLFEVVSLLKPVSLKIQKLARGQERVDARPAVDCLVFVENRHRKIFIRRGLNQNDGTAQKEVFVLRRDGSIEGAIDWDYDPVTRVEARPVDPRPLILRGGVFTHVGNRMRQEKGYNYWARNIEIRRSNTEVDGLTHRVTGETDVGHPYGGFLSIQQCANITLRNCSIDGRRTYRTIGAAGKPVSMGSYGYGVSLVVNFHMINCRMDRIDDRTRWGVIGSNFMKNILLEDCVLSRMDVHQGVSGSYVIRRCTLGHAGLNAVGRGRLVVEESTLHGSNLITFRSDYGSPWDGEVLIRDCRWIPSGGAPSRPVMFGMQNDGTHDFGYPCSMPREIRIEGLFVDDSNHPKDYEGVVFFADPLGGSHADRPHPYAVTKTVTVRGLTTASGKPPRVSSNAELAKAITLQ